MRIHTDKLTPQHLYDATKNIDGVFVDFIALHNSRKKAQGIEFRLEADEGEDYNGKKRRPRNSGRYGTTDTVIKAATYDEHGKFMAQLFASDPDAIIGPYKGLEDFHSCTNWDYERFVKVK